MRKHILFTLATLMLILAGCSQSEEALLQSVPDNANFIATIKLDKILKEAGCQIKNGEYIPGPELSSFLGNNPQSNLKVLSLLSGTCDLNKTVMFSGEGYDPVVTLHCSDTDRLINSFGETFAVKPMPQENGYKIVRIDYGNENYDFLIIDGNQIWISKDAEQSLQAITRAKKNPIAALIGVKQWLEQDQLVNFAAKSSLPDNLWICFGADTSRDICGYEIQLMTSEGKVTPIGEDFSTLSTDFLRYVPDNSQLVLATTLPSNLDLSTIALFLPQEARGYMPMVNELAKKINGTVAVAVGPAGAARSLADFDSGSWDFFIMAHMEQADVNSYVDQITSLAKSIGVPVVNETEGLYRIDLSQADLGYTEVYVGNVDGYLTLSSRQPLPNAANSLTDTFLNRKGAISVNIPYGSETMKAFNLPLGVSLQGELTTNSFKGNLRFNGSNSSFIPALLTVLAAR